jgi:hypothetical protein
MSCPNVPKAAPALTGSDLREDCLVGERDTFLCAHPKAKTQAWRKAEIAIGWRRPVKVVVRKRRRL